MRQCVVYCRPLRLSDKYQNLVHLPILLCLWQLCSLHIWKTFSPTSLKPNVFRLEKTFSVVRQGCFSNFSTEMYFMGYENLLSAMMGENKNLHGETMGINKASQ